MTLHELLVDIHALNKQLTKYEEKYGLLSDAFYRWYSQGHEPEDDAWVLDFSVWAGLYKIELERERMYDEWWYDPQPHPDDPTLASTHPHYKHIPPQIKRNRIPAPGLSFKRPNLPFLIEEIEQELLT